MTETDGKDDGLQVDIFDHQSLAPLVSVHTQTFKHRVITLHNPPYSVDLDSTGRIHWEFTFIWEGEWKVYWRRDTVGMSGKSKGYTAYLVSNIPRTTGRARADDRKAPQARPGRQHCGLPSFRGGRIHPIL